MSRPFPNYLYCIFSGSSRTSSNSSRTRLCLATGERASKPAGGGPRLSHSYNTGQSTARHTLGTRQNGANETKHHPLLQSTADLTSGARWRKLLPVCIYSTCPWDALATSYPGALCPPPSHPFSPARAYVCCGRNHLPSHTLKKASPAPCSPPCTPITAAQLAYYVTKLPATTTH